MRKYKNEKDFEEFLRTEDYCPDLVNIDGVIFTMDNYDEEGKEISFGNKKHDKSFIVKTEDSFKSAVVEDIYESDCFRNDIVYYE